MQKQFFIATSAEMTNIMISCDEHFGTKMCKGWKMIKEQFLITTESDNRLPRKRWADYYKASTSFDDNDRSRKDHKKIPWGPHTLFDFLNIFPEVLSYFGLIIEVPKNVKWEDCPVKAICNGHVMKESEINIARSSYPDYHKENTKYQKTPKYHIACRIHKQSVHQGACRVYVDKQRARDHIFKKSGHLNCYHFIEFVMLSIYIYI